MPTLAAWTIYIFGATAFVAGCWQLTSPESAVKSLGLGTECVPAANGAFPFFPFFIRLYPALTCNIHNQN